MKKIIFLFFSLVFIQFTFGQTTHYVSPSGGNQSPYTSWTDAATNIQDAIDVASAGDLVLVGDGTYTLSVNISITAGIELRSVNGYGTTIIDGNSFTRCLYLNDANAVVDGFTIQNGYFPGGFGGGADIDNGGTIKNCYITGNQARDGGGVAIGNNGLVENCFIVGNSADNNSSNGYGGGVRILNAGAVRGCVIYGNTSQRYGGGVNIWNGGTVENCTISGNDAPYGGGIRARNNSVIKNSVIYFNTSANTPNWETSGSGFSFTNSCSTPALPGGSGNITADPMFDDQPANDYHISLGSPLIDAGVNDAWMSGNFDIDGNQRIYNGTVDIGAYEYSISAPNAPTLISPVDFAAGVSIEPEFTWNAAATADSYALEVATDDLFNNIVSTASGITTTNYTVTGLSNSVQYYWRVSATNAGGTSGWSDVWSFTTTSEIIPILSWPIGGAAVYTTSPQLFWWSMAQNYDLLYSTDAAMSGATVISNINATSYTLTGLANGTVYYWQMRAKTSTGAIAGYSAIESFETPAAILPGTPIPSWPIGGATVYTDSPILYWYLNGNSLGLTYEVEYSAGALTGTPTITGITMQNLALTGLTEGATYNWQARSTDGTNYSDWSVQESFVVYSSTSAAVDVIPSWPVGGADVYTTSPTLYWYLDSYATGLTYEVEYSTGALTGTPTLTGITDLYVQLSGLTNEATYNWQVRSNNGTTTSAWSSPESFVVNAGNLGPIVPTPSWPVGGAVEYDLTPTLYWYVGGNSTGFEYEVLYSTSSVTSGGVLQNATATAGWTSSSYVELPALTPGAVYYWQIRSRLSSAPAQVSAYSAVESFATAASAAPVVLIPGSPTGNVTIKTDSPTLSWILPTHSESDLTYEMEIADNPEMTGAQTFGNLEESYYALNGLKAGENYFWRVKSTNAEGVSSQFSDIGSFKIDENVTDVTGEIEIPSIFTVSQNYPNPFNPSTTIEFGLPEASFVSIRIYNMLGQEVNTLVSSDFNAGTYRTVWNGTDNSGNKVASGTYIYRVTSGKNAATKKLILLK
ncbi:MAG: T9SS type A sorting domain-containing protein [Chlorobi bacterium]|nr:T9SS type A sorting domain-containing protein [Chlorobiota bacterium]